MRFTRPLVLPARVGVYVRGDKVWVGDAPGGGAYLEGTFRSATSWASMSDFLLELSQESRTRAS